MARGRRPIRGGKRSTDRHKSRLQKPKKKKKGKFNLREASYVKERDAKNAEIESRRKRLEEEEAARKRKYESDTSEEEADEEDPMKMLLSTFSGSPEKRSRTAIESDSEGEDEHSAAEDEPEEVSVPPVPAPVGDVDEENEGNEIDIQPREEAEEDEETAREDAGNVQDSFALHLNYDLSEELYEAVSSTNSTVETHKFAWPVLGNIVVQIPKISTDNDSPESSKKALIFEKKIFAKHASVPAIIDKIDWSKLHVKSQIHNNITRANYVNIKDSLVSDSSALTPLQRELFSIVNNYQDLLYCERTFSNENEVRFVYCLHAINHLLKTRTKILHHNAKLAKTNKLSMGEIPDEYRDQGLVRPKILIILPFRHSCLRVVEMLIAILIGEDKGGSVMNKRRFLEEFGGGEVTRPRRNPKPEDYDLTFRGNTDDTFKIGIAVTKKTLKLYSEFYSSDIIISSVLGLRMLVGAEGEEDRDYDFLASIELLVMDQAELFFMQNWDHLVHVLSHLHLQPKKSHNTDFSRVRSWSVNGWAKYYRQTLIFSSIQLPEINAIFSKKCHNYAGRIKVSNPRASGSACQVVVQLPQVFHKFNATSPVHAIEARMEFFVSKILPQYRDSIMNHTLIFVPSYFDFVKIRNYLKKEEVSFVQICEYTRDAKVARARDMFFHSDAHFLLYSERFHFFRRVRVKGIRHLIFFAPPTFPHFYAEMCNLMHKANQNCRSGSDSNMTVTVLYSKYDAIQLSGVVGTERAARMITSDKSVHMLMTGE